MGSLNANGTSITRKNHTYRNIGRAITTNVLGEVGDVETLVETSESAAVLSEYAESEKTVVTYGRTVKTTDSVLDALVERNSVLPGETAETPSVSRDKVNFTAVTYGPTVKITESEDDSLISRKFS